VETLDKVQRHKGSHNIPHKMTQLNERFLEVFDKFWDRFSLGHFGKL